MIDAPGDPIGRQRVRPEAPVTVHGRRGEGGGPRRVFEQAAEIGFARRRQHFAFPVRHEQVAPGSVDQRLMQVPAARIVARNRRTRHERCEIAHAPANLPGRRTEQDEIVRCFQRRARREGAFDLARTPFIFQRAQRKPELFIGVGQRRQHRLHEIEIALGMQRVAGLDRNRGDRPAARSRRADIFGGEMRLVHAQQIPLDFQPDDGAHAARVEPPQLPTQEMARRKMERRAVGEIFVAQHPADVGRPGQYAKRRRIGHDDQVGRSGHLVEAHAAAAGKGREDAPTGGIERRGGDVDVVTVLQRTEKSRYGQRLGARGPVRIGPGDADQPQLFALDVLRQLARLSVLVLRPQIVAGYETRRGIRSVQVDKPPPCAP